MTILECYETMGADYYEVLGRFQKESLVERFFLKFENDKTFEELMAACEKRDRSEAFRAAHSLKGVAGNLALTRLNKAAANLTEQLRKGDEDPDSELVSKVIAEYRVVAEALRNYKAGK